MTADLARQVYRSLDPLSPLEPGSAAYVERPDNPLDRVRVELELSSRPRHYLLAGHRGTGKTTELLRLENQLRAEPREVFLVDVGATVAPAGTPPGEVIFRTMRDFFDPDLNPTRFPKSWNLMAPMIVGGAIGREKRWSDTVSILEDLMRFGDKAKPPVIVLDGLERLTDSDVLEALLEPTPLSAWPVSVICTIPLSAYLLDDLGEHARQFDRSIFLPGIATVTRDGRRVDAGLEALASIIETRVSPQEEPGPVFQGAALELLAESSAGIHRELLQIAQRAVVLSALDEASTITLAHAEAAVDEQRNEYSVVLRTQDFPLLEHVMLTKELPGGSETARLIRNQLIVAYSDNTTWFDVHPIIKPLVERRSA